MYKRGVEKNFAIGAVFGIIPTGKACHPGYHIHGCQKQKPSEQPIALPTLPFSTIKKHPGIHQDMDKKYKQQGAVKIEIKKQGKINFIDPLTNVNTSLQME
jgi:hypothetical protein